MTINEAFEKWCDENGNYVDENYYHQGSQVRRKYNYALQLVWEASAQHYEREIAELKEKHIMQLAGISTASIGYFKDGDEIHPDYDTVALRDVTSLYDKYHDTFKGNIELQSSNNTLREALEFYANLDWKDNTEAWQLPAKQSLSATPAESLAKRDAELIEKCAKVCDEQGNEWDSDSQITHLNYAEHCAMVIRNLKEVK